MDLFSPGAASVLVHVGARVGGLLLVAPVFSSRTVPVRVRTGLLMMLAVLMQPAALAGVAEAPRVSPATLLTETLIGFGVGLGAALFVGAAELAGDFLSMQIGLSGAAVLDPTSGSQVPVLGHFVHMFTVVVLLSLDAHLFMLDSLAESFRFLPVGSPVELRGGLASMVSLGAMLFSLGLRFAAPVITAVLIANGALAVLTRAAPQLNVLGIAFPLQIGVGLLTLAATVPLMAAGFMNWNVEYDGVLTRILAALAGG